MYCSKCGRENADNTSFCTSCGTLQVVAEQPTTPSEIRGWNWGAFCFTWIWGIRFRVWISLLALIPFVNFVMMFVLGAAGSEWAWKKNQWLGIHEFKKSRRRWNIAAGVFITILIIGGISALLLDWYHKRPKVVTELGNVSLGMTLLEVKIALGNPNDESTDSDGSTLFYSDYTGDLDYFIRLERGEDEERVVLACTESYYRDVLSLGRYDSEKEVLSKLGPPTNVSVRADGLAKFMSYERWKVAYAIEKGQVQMICVTSSGKASYMDEYQ